MKNIKTGVINMRYKAIILTTFLILSLAIVAMPKVKAQENNQYTYSETRDLGWITTANSTGEVEVDIYNETTWDLPGASGSTS